MVCYPAGESRDAEIGRLEAWIDDLVERFCPVKDEILIVFGYGF